MGTVLLVLAAVTLVAVGAHAVLVWLAFRVSKRWGWAALFLPPVAWCVPFRGPAPQRVWAGIAFGCVLTCGIVVGYGLRELRHPVEIGGVSVGEPSPR